MQTLTNDHFDTRLQELAMMDTIETEKLDAAVEAIKRQANIEQVQTVNEER